MSIGIGEALRKAREGQGRTVQDAAHSLRVRNDYVEALEAERFEIFSADTYARGHLRNYANLLGIDPEPLLDSYDSNVREDDASAHQMADAPVALKPREPLPRWITWVVGGIVVLGAIALIGLFGNRTPEATEEDPDGLDTPTATDEATDSETDAANDAATDDAADGATDGSEQNNQTDNQTDGGTDGGENTDGANEPEEQQFDGVQVILAFEGESWVGVERDGEFHLDETVPAGETRIIEADELVQVNFGIPNNVVVEVNGESYGKPGGPDEWGVVVQYGPDGPVDDS